MRGAHSLCANERDTVPAGLKNALGRATVARDSVAIIALIVSEVKAVAADLSALGEADSGILVAGEALLKFAGARAAIVRVSVAVVALLTSDNQLVSADWLADCPARLDAPVAVPARFDGAFR